jgi:DNA-directed RNA polymerase specialized sigma24 family protein
MTLYMKVSNDKYELPEIIARTTIELAEKCGVKSQTVRSAMSHAKKHG